VILGCLLAVILPGCSNVEQTSEGFEMGMKPSSVRVQLGDPESQQEFVMPEAPFFGPQEALTETVEPGTPVLEWRYERGDQLLYLWFTPTGETDVEGWALQHWFEAPADAVY
jgi:hypothetical protein